MIFKNRLIQHILFWLAACVFFFFVFHRDTFWGTLRINFGFLPGHLLFTYLLMYLLVPHFILKRRIAGSIGMVIAITAIGILYCRIADVYILHYGPYPALWWPLTFPRIIFALFSVGWIAVFIKMVKYWYLEKEVRQKLEKEKLTVELQLLRSQLHPHFLFNALNSLYSRTLDNSQQASSLVLRLSELLRYMLYECDEPVVDLSKEIGTVKNYIELEKSRFGDRLDLAMTVTGDVENKKIAPMLLLPFVENSVKHGIGSQLEKSWISLHLHVEADRLDFTLTNSREDTIPHPGRPSGMGLLNVQRRLNLLYPRQHVLRIIPEDETFTVSLQIQLTAPPKGISSPKYDEAQMSYC